jgi:hypothetical protein
MSDSQLSQIQARLVELFPQCRDRRGFTPHLSLGQFKSLAALEAGQQEFEESWGAGHSFVLQNLQLISRRSKTDPFAVRHSLPLKGL